MSGVVADTSVWIDFLAGRSASALEDALAAGIVILPPLVVAELVSGARRPRDRAAIVRGDAVTESAPDLDAISVVADLGDAVVVSVPDVAGEREPTSLLMMRSEAGWRLREWFD